MINVLASLVGAPVFAMGGRQQSIAT
jgi:hypothetical protein